MQADMSSVEVLLNLSGPEPARKEHWNRIRR